MVGFHKIAWRLLTDWVCLCWLMTRSQQAVEAENLFLRRQLAMCRERGIKPRRIDAATRVSLVLLSKWFNWREALFVVRPETLIRWHRAGWRLFWHYKCRTGRPPIPVELRQLIRRMWRDNSSWGQERIANELLLKLGIRVSPSTVAKYTPKLPSGCPRGDQRWSTFLRNHAQGVLACDFFLAVTATFRSLYVFVVIHHASPRLIHFNVTDHPTSAWTLQQLREAIGEQDGYRYLLHDRDTIFAEHLDSSIRAFGLKVLKSLPKSPRANSVCERLIGTIRRECLDWMIPSSASHLRKLPKEWGGHYNEGRAHMSLGPGIPDPPADAVAKVLPPTRHRLLEGLVVRTQSILGGLHHEYSYATAV